MYEGYYFVIIKIQYSDPILITVIKPIESLYFRKRGNPKIKMFKFKIPKVKL